MPRHPLPTLSLLALALLFLAPSTRAQLTPDLVLSTGLPHNTPQFALSPDGQVLLTTQYDGAAIFAETATGRTLNTLDLGYDRYTTPYQPIYASNKTVYFLSEKRIQSFDIPSFSFGRDLNVPQPTAYLRDSTTGNLLVAGQRGNRATLWTVDPSNNRIRPFHTCNQSKLDAITQIQLAPDENLALLSFKSGAAELLKTGPRWAIAKTYPATKDRRYLLPDGHILNIPSGFIKALTLSNPADASIPVTIALPVGLVQHDRPTQRINHAIPPQDASQPTLVISDDAIYHLDPQSHTLSLYHSFRTDASHSSKIRKLISSPNFKHTIAHVSRSSDYSETFLASPHNVAGATFSRWDADAFKPKTLQTSQSSRILLVRDGEGLVKHVTLKPTGLEVSSFQGDFFTETSLATQTNESAVSIFSPSYQTKNLHNTKIYPSSLTNATHQILHKDNTAHDLPFKKPTPILSPAGSFLLLSHSDGFQVREANGKFLWKLDHGDFKATHFTFSQDQSLLFFAKLRSQHSKSTIVATDAHSGKTLWEVSGHPLALRHDSVDNVLRFATEKSYVSSQGGKDHRYLRHFINTVDATTGTVQGTPASIVATADYPDFVAATPDGKRWIFQNDKTLSVAKHPSYVIASTIPLSNRVSKGSFLNGSRHLVAISDSKLSFFDTDSAQHLGDLTLMQNNASWAFAAPTGLFDAPAAAHDSLDFAFGITPVPLASFFEPYYRPRLLDDLLNGRNITPAALDFAELATPPSTKATLLNSDTQNILTSDTTKQDELLLNIAIASGVTPVRELRIFHNGKRLALSTRGLFVEDDLSDPAVTAATPSYKHNRQIPVRLLPGENTFTVVALNAQNIESPPTELKIHLEVDPNKKRPELHLVAIGIDEYQNEKYNLNYAVADASAFAESLRKKSEKLFSKLNYYPIKNGEAIKQRLVSVLEEVQTTASPTDVFIFYYAGHGVVTKEGRGDFFIVPHDVTQLYGADDQLAHRGLSSGQLQEISSLISAQKQLFILDACQSGGALSSIKQRGAAEERAIAQLARSTGTHWLTASGSQQFATEFADLGHGAFTYTLLRALEGLADTGDGRVTVNELKAYLESQVPEVTAQYKGTAQYPASYGYGQDFPVVLLP
ncbi:caspase family protein [Puniceicoccaceae bacterium K14]|nr:caspase family protein [Puniceicoccaceae bacterium K14]